MLSFLKKSFNINQKTLYSGLTTDMHLHILPAIDDGASTMEESLSLIEQLMNLGYKKLVATPHVISDFFMNTPQIIHAKLTELRQAVAEKGWKIEITAAAEYYLDEALIDKLHKQEPLLTFGDNYLLFETAFINSHPQLQEAVFLMQSSNYQPVLAHPERYMYLQNNFNKCIELADNGVLLQININSLSGYYSLPAQLLAEKLIDHKMVHFAGTDCHHSKHIQSLQTAQSKNYYVKLLDMDLLNHKL